MKKFLSIILSVIMILGVCSVGAFALLVEELPAMPKQTDGRIYFAADNADVTGAGEYVVPIYLISKITPVDAEGKEITNGFAQLGFVPYLTGLDGAEITAINYSADLKKFSKFHEIESQVLADEDCTEENNVYHPAGGAYFAFAADVSILNQAMLHVADITVSIPETFDPDETCVTVEFTEFYNFVEAPRGYCLEVEDDVICCCAVFAGEIDDAAFEDFAERAPDMMLKVQSEADGNIYYKFGKLATYEYPPVPTWKERIVNWFADQVEELLVIFEGLHEKVRFVLNIIRALV